MKLLHRIKGYEEKSSFESLFSESSGWWDGVIIFITKKDLELRTDLDMYSDTATGSPVIEIGYNHLFNCRTRRG